MVMAGYIPSGTDSRGTQQGDKRRRFGMEQGGDDNFKKRVLEYLLVRDCSKRPVAYEHFVNLWLVITCRLERSGSWACSTV